MTKKNENESVKNNTLSTGTSSVKTSKINNPVDISEALSVGWELFKNNIWISILLALIPIILQLIPIVGGIINLILAPGIIYAFIKLYDKKNVTVNDIIEKINKVFPYIGTQFIFMFIIMGGFMFFIIPGFITEIALSFTILLLIDKNMSVMESIRTSWAITEGYRWKILLLFIVITLIFIIVTLLTLGLGLLVLIPVIFFASFHIYRNLFKQAEKDNKIPVDKLQTWPKVFLWVGIIVVPLMLFVAISSISLRPAREKAQQQHQNEMEQYNNLQNDNQAIPDNVK